MISCNCIKFVSSTANVSANLRINQMIIPLNAEVGKSEKVGSPILLSSHCYQTNKSWYQFSEFHKNIQTHSCINVLFLKMSFTHVRTISELPNGTCEILVVYILFDLFKVYKQKRNMGKTY